MKFQFLYLVIYITIFVYFFFRCPICIPLVTQSFRQALIQRTVPYQFNLIATFLLNNLVLLLFSVRLQIFLHPNISFVLLCFIWSCNRFRLPFLTLTWTWFALTSFVDRADSVSFLVSFFLLYFPEYILNRLASDFFPCGHAHVLPPLSLLCHHISVMIVWLVCVCH